MGTELPVKSERNKTPQYALSTDGKVLTLVTTRTAPRGQVTSKEVFTRQTDK